MLKNIAGQFVGVQMVSSSDGTAFSGAVTVYVTVDNGTQTIGSVGSGVCSHKGNGLYNYAPSQAETNGSSIQFTFIGTGAIPQTIQFETLPTTGVLAPTVANRTIAVSATNGKVTAEAVELDSASRDAVADAVWDEAMADHTNSGSYGGRVVRASNSNTTVQITGSNHVAADVHEFQAGVITAGDFANNSITAAALAADAVAEIQNGLSTLTAPQVNAEVVDALSIDTYAELTAPPAATSSLKDKLTWLFMYARNKVTQTASQRKLYRDDGTTVAGTSGTSDDGTTFTKGEDA